MRVYFPFTPHACHYASARASNLGKQAETPIGGGSDPFRPEKFPNFPSLSRAKKKKIRDPEGPENVGTRAATSRCSTCSSGFPPQNRQNTNRHSQVHGSRIRDGLCFFGFGGVVGVVACFQRLHSVVLLVLQDSAVSGVKLSVVACFSRFGAEGCQDLWTHVV